MQSILKQIIDNILSMTDYRILLQSDGNDFIDIKKDYSNTVFEFIQTDENIILNTYIYGFVEKYQNIARFKIDSDIDDITNNILAFV